ncbi:MAG: glycosyltransferase family 4 protein [Bacteroidetes bacterium]|nr:glycosyltransferase family 4 protein [Bacteroidota bacterium]
MRIGFDAKRLYCNFTGLGNYSRTLLKNLGEFYPDNEYFLYTPKIKISPETKFFLESSDYQTHLCTSFFKSFWRSYSIVDQLKKDKIELYHGLSHELPVNIHKSKIKSIVTIHDLIFKQYPQNYPAFDRKVYDLKFKNSCIHADRIIAISNSTKNDIIKFYNINPDKIDVVHQSCNPIYFEETESDESAAVLQQYNIPDEYLLYVGSVEKRKNLKALIEAYQKLPSDVKVPLVIVGKGKKYKEEIKELIKVSGIGKLIIWIDNLQSNHHLQSVYQNSLALIYPSFYEGFGLPVIEALLSKTPVITSNVSSLPEAAGPNSFCIDPNNSEEIADAIKQVLSNYELRENMKIEGYKYAMENFAAQIVTKKMIESYKQTLQNNS